MSSGKKLLYGLLAIAPLPFIGMYIYSIFIMMVDVSSMQYMDDVGPPPQVMEHVGKMLLYIGLGSILAIVGLIFYIVDIVKNKKFTETNSSLKVVWILVVILLSNIGMLIYFFAEIIGRKEDEDYYADPITDRTN